jgi:hypothetical protein
MGSRCMASGRSSTLSDLASGNGTYVVAMAVLAALAVIGFAAAIFLPSHPETQGTAARRDALGTALEPG